jgi:hypothetical protein
MSYHAHTTTPYQYLYEVEGSNYSVPDDTRTSFRPRVDQSSLSKTLVIVEEYAYNMATPQSKDGYITIPSLVSLKVCSRFERPSSPQYSGSASEIRPRYRKSCTTSFIKGIRHLPHSRRVEDGHPTRSSSATTAWICSNVARILYLLSARLQWVPSSWCQSFSEGFGFQAKEGCTNVCCGSCCSADGCTLWRCSGVYRCFPVSLYPILLVKFLQYYRTGDFP